MTTPTPVKYTVWTLAHGVYSPGSFNTFAMAESVAQRYALKEGHTSAWVTTSGNGRDDIVFDVDKARHPQGD